MRQPVLVLCDEHMQHMTVFSVNSAPRQPVSGADLIQSRLRPQRFLTRQCGTSAAQMGCVAAGYGMGCWGF